jgi:hypothetical protein
MVLVSADGDSVKGTLLAVAMPLRYIVSVSVVLRTRPSLSVAVRVDVGVWSLRNVKQAWATVLVCWLIGRCGTGRTLTVG